MITRERLSRIFWLALPIIGGMISQNVLNLVDTAMVGTLGNAALAAVGLGGFALFASQALILGISTGVQATASRRKGEGRLDRTAVPLDAGLLIVVCVAPALSALLYFLAPHFYPYLNADPDVIELGVSYYAIRVLSITFVGMNFAFRGFWNAIDMSRLYMTTLIIMHSCNIFLNYVLIFGKFGAPAMGVAGAATASAVSMVIGTAIYFYLGFKHARKNGFLRGLPHRREVFTLIRLSLPTGIQQLAFSAGFVATYWIIGKIGTPELAAANVLINVMLVAILPGLGFGLAAATLVGQALGRGEPDDASRWGWDVGKVGMIGLGVIGLPMWIAPDLILAVFIHDSHTLDIARLPMRLVGLAMPIEALGMVTMHGLLGAGDTRRVMLASVAAQWIIFLPLAYFVGPVLGFGLLAVWGLQVGYRAALSLTFSFLWYRGDWRGIVL